jgi:hypothetical protein
MHDEEQSGSDSDEYMSIGYFDPLLAKRIMKRLSRENIRFAARDASGIGICGAELPYERPSPEPYPVLHRESRIELFIYTADTSKARSAIDEV